MNKKEKKKTDKNQYSIKDNDRALMYIGYTIQSLYKAIRIADMIEKEQVADPVIVKAFQWFLFDAMTQYFRFAETLTKTDVESEKVANAIDTIEEILQKVKKGEK